MSRTEVAEWEEPRHPGPAWHEVLPHFIPLCNTIVVNCPTRLESWTDVGPESACLQAIRGGTERGRGARESQDPVQKARLHVSLPASGRVPTLGGRFRRSMCVKARL